MILNNDKKFDFFCSVRYNIYFSDYFQLLFYYSFMQSHNIVGVRLDCSASKNLMSHQNTLVVSEDIEPKAIEVRNIQFNGSKGS